MRYYGMPAFKTQESAGREIRWFNRIFLREEGIRWAITTIDNDDYIGDIGFMNYSKQHRRAEIGFKLIRKYWRRGWMSAAIHAALQYGFNEMKLNRVEALVDSRNDPCLQLLRKAGFAREGVFREYEMDENGYADLAMLSILKSEYSRAEIRA